MNRQCAFISAVIVMAFTILVFPVFAAADPDTTGEQGLSIVAQPSKQTFASGEPVKVDVIIRNSSSADASIGGSAFDLSSFRFVVLDPASQSVGETAYGKKLLAIPKKVKTNEPLKIGAGWQRRYQFDLGRMYDLTGPGMYSITVKRVVVVNHRDPSTGHMAAQVVLLSSDPVAITVTGTPPAAKPAVEAKSPKAALRLTIAFVREGDIWVADGDGNEQRLIIHDGDTPSWSPDKSLIAFARKGNVWVSDPDGQNQRELTESSSLEAGVNPVFSPDGRWIAYRSWNEQVGIMVREVSIDGKIDKELIQDAESPAW